MDTAFVHSARPIHFRVLGRKLQPLTLGHLFLLARHAPSFLHPRAKEENLFESLVAAVFLCSHREGVAARRIEARGAGLRAALWALRFRARLELQSWCSGKRDKFLRLRVLREELDRFESYLKFHLSTPVSEPVQPRTGRDVNAPLHWALASALMTELGIDIDAARRWRTLDIQCLLATLAERRGQISIYSDERIEMIRELIRDSEMRKEATDGHA